MKNTAPTKTNRTLAIIGIISMLIYIFITLKLFMPIIPSIIFSIFFTCTIMISLWLVFLQIILKTKIMFLIILLLITSSLVIANILFCNNIQIHYAFGVLGKSLLVYTIRVAALKNHIDKN